RASFSATGSSLELVAPGVRVVSTYPLSLGGPYHSDDGTSDSAPHVAGVAALIKGTEERLWYPTITNGDSIWTSDEIRKVLDTTAVDLGPSGKDPDYGFGRVDAANAVRSSSIELMINTEESGGNPIFGYYTILSQGGSTVTSDFSPASFTLNRGQEYQVAVADYGDYVFDHWKDTGSKMRERSVSALSDIQYSAVYRNTNNNNSPESHQSSVEVESVDSLGGRIYGYYTTLSQGNVVIASGFTPVTFTLSAGQEYQVAIQDYGSYFFNKWLGDGSTVRERTVTAEMNSSTVLTAVYSNVVPLARGQSTVSVISKDSQGNAITGYYTTLWQGGSFIDWAFSPATFTVNNNQEYQVAVADYGNYIFDHWEQ